MKKYVVRVREVWFSEIFVEANTAEQAKEKANKLIEKEDFPGEYEYTLEPDLWDVEEN